MVSSSILQLAKLVWDYHQLHHPLQKSDCILALGSHDLRVGAWAAELYLQGWAPLLVLSGGLGRLTSGQWQQTEADRFAEIARNKGVPEEALLLEKTSTNTGENILFTQDLLHAHGLQPKTFIVVQKPYMERRTYATFKKQWPGKAFIVSSPPIPFTEYATADMPLDTVISIMVGDLQRIKLYPAKRFQVAQEIPDAVWKAYEELVAHGFTQHLVKE